MKTNTTLNAQLFEQYNSELKALATSVEIDLLKLFNKIFKTEDKPITKGIGLKKSSKVIAMFSKEIINDQVYLNLKFLNYKSKRYIEISTYNPTSIFQKLSIITKENFIRGTEFHTPQQKQRLSVGMNLWNNASSTNIKSHNYAFKKNLQLTDCQVKRTHDMYNNDILIIPIFSDIKQTSIVAFQTIDTKGNKCIYGASNYGFHIIGDVNKVTHTTGICEGFATGDACYNAESTKDKTIFDNKTKMPIIVCFGATNIPNVLSIIKPNKTIILSDNDQKPNGINTGLYYSMIASKEVHSSKIYLPQSKGDFNDSLVFNEYKIPSASLEYKKSILRCAPNSNNKLHSIDLIRAYAAKIPNKIDSITAANEIYNILKHKENAFDELYIFNQLEAYSSKYRIENNLQISTIENPIEFETNESLTEFMITEGRKGNRIFLNVSDIGTGKTKTMLNVFNAFDTNGTSSVLDISYRISLLLKSSNLLNTTMYSDKECILDDKKLSVTINSLLKVSKESRSLINLDEIRYLLEALHTSSTIKNKKAIETQLITFCKQADLVICSDALANEMVMDFLKRTDKIIHIVKVKSKPVDKKLMLYRNHEQLTKKLLDVADKGLPLFASFDTEIEMLNVMTGVQNKFPHLKLLSITGKNKHLYEQSAFLSNPNEESLKYDGIFHTPVINAGISIEHDYFKEVFFFRNGIATSAESFQTIGRVRTAKTIHCSLMNLSVKELNSFDHLKTVDDYKGFLQDYFKEGSMLGSEFGKRNLKIISDRNKDLNNGSNNFCYTAEAKGYKLEYANDNFDEIEVEKLKSNIKKEMKKKVVEAQIISDAEYISLVSRKVKTEQVQHEIFRYEVAQLKGSNDITQKDITNYKNDLNVKENHRIVTSTVEDLIKNDEQHRLNGNNKSEMLLKTLWDTLLKKVGDEVNEYTVIDAMIFIEENKTEFNICGIHCSNSLNHKRQVRGFSNFISQFGFKLEKIKQYHSGQRTFKIIEVDKKRPLQS